MGVLHYLFKMCFALLQLLGCMCLTVHLDQAHVEDTPGQTQTRVRKWCVCVCVCVCACVCVGRGGVRPSLACYPSLCS